MDTEYRRQGDVIEFWRAVELFSPQQVPKVDKFDTLSRVEKATLHDRACPESNRPAGILR
ncbi:hypothetical protein ACFWB0_05955 [Rhodococcus sp. NPDC060086]|uniref:hypothetical protein n=1 Tax=Rhodococcus sp. NPDC060086 TaxID=3347055 RepID=UPI003669B7E0